MEKMDKKSLKKQQSIKEQNSAYKNECEILAAKYEKLKDIAKQVLKELNYEKEKQRLLRSEYEKLVEETKEKDDLIERMQSVSEAVIDEYSALKLKCDLEVEAATEASKRATKYFEENKKLKGSKIQELEDNCTNIYDNLPNDGYDSIPYNEYDELPIRRQKLESISELDMLNNLASELRTEIASLKVQLEKEMENQNALKEELEIAKSLYEQEVQEHNETRKNVGSHEIDSIGSANESPETKSLETSIDKSTMTLEPDQDLNDDDCSNAKNTPEDFHSTSICLELSEQVESFKKQNDELSIRIRELEKENQKLRAETSASLSLPIPPPPPPPPPPSFNPIKSLITFIHAGKKSGKPKNKIENVETEHEKAMSEMINVIKKGQVRLKPTPKVTSAQSPKTEETALGEMKSILSTLKKKGIAAKESEILEDKKKLEDIHKSHENVSISSDVDDELKALLRKRSLKSITDPNACALSVAGSSEESLVGHEAECHIYSLSNLKLKEEDESNSFIEDEALSQFSSPDSMNSGENRSIEDLQALKKETSDIVM